MSNVRLHMTPLILRPSSVRSLRWLVGARADQIVWDINAIYVVGPNSTTKIEATSVTPHSAEPHEFDEVFPISVSVTHQAQRFQADGEPGLAYRVLVENEYITDIEIVRLA